MPEKDRFKRSNLPHAQNPFWSGPGFSRRQFFTLTGSGLMGYYFTKVMRPLDVIAASKATTRNTAKNCIFVFLAGGPSHVDTFDLKEGAWLPANFAPTSYGDTRFPQGLMPKLAEQLDRMVILRSVKSWGLVHGLLQVWTQIARNPGAALGKIAPHIGSVVAVEKEQPGAKLPGFLAINAGNVVRQGFLSSRYAPFMVGTSATGLPGSTHPDGKGSFDSRLQLLNSIDGSLRANHPYGRDDYAVFYEQALDLMYNPVVDAAFKYTTEERARYGNNGFGDSCLVAQKVLKANLGARFIQITLGGWDNHSNIYAPNAGIYSRTRTLDDGVSTLLKDLAAAPGTEPGKSLLDETLVVMMGEFGRTVKGLNVQQGRDHHLQQCVVFAGGGTKGGRVIGATDSTGALVETPGWTRDRPIRVEDVAATIYSALGIDWTKVRYDDPFKRGFEYVPFAASHDAYGPVDEIFGPSGVTA